MSTPWEVVWNTRCAHHVATTGAVDVTGTGSRSTCQNEEGTGGRMLRMMHGAVPVERPGSGPGGEAPVGLMQPHELVLRGPIPAPLPLLGNHHHLRGTCAGVVVVVCVGGENGIWLRSVGQSLGVSRSATITETGSAKTKEQRRLKGGSDAYTSFCRHAHACCRPGCYDGTAWGQAGAGTRWTARGRVVSQTTRRYSMLGKGLGKWRRGLGEGN